MAASARPPDPEASVAVLFGFSRYDDYQELPALPTVERSVADLADLLTAPATGGFAAANRLVETEECTVEDFGIRFEQAADKARDVLLVYYCGHGIFDASPLTGRLYLAFPRTRKDHFHFTALALRDVRRVIAGSRARNKILILDCCYSGQVHTQGGRADLQDQLEIAGTYALSSSTGLEPALAPPGMTHTAFTGALLSVLDAGTRTPDPVPIRDVFAQVSAAMRQLGLPSPSQSSTHTTDLIALVRSRLPRPVLAQPDAPRPGAAPELPRLILPPQRDWADAATVDFVCQFLNDPVRGADVEQRISRLADRLQSALADIGAPPAPDTPGLDVATALAQSLEGYEQAAAPMVRILAFGGRYGQPRHDAIWLRVLDRILNRRHTPPAALRDAFAAAERYPALLLVTALGAAAVSAGRPSLAYRALAEVTFRPSADRNGSALVALIPMRVVASDLAASLPGWGYEPSDLAVSAHLRHHLRRAFDGILSDSDYPGAFAAYEYLRRLLEVDVVGFSSAGPLAAGRPGGNASEVNLDLTEGSALLQAGAFGGDPGRAARARTRIGASLHRDGRSG